MYSAAVLRITFIAAVFFMLWVCLCYISLQLQHLQSSSCPPSGCSWWWRHVVSEAVFANFNLPALCRVRAVLEFLGPVCSSGWSCFYYLLVVAAPSVSILSVACAVSMVALLGFRGQFRELQPARALPNTFCVEIPWTCVSFTLVMLVLLVCGAASSVSISSAACAFLMVAPFGFRGHVCELQLARALQSTFCVGALRTYVFFMLVVLLLLATWCRRAQSSSCPSSVRSRWWRYSASESTFVNYNLPVLAVCVLQWSSSDRILVLIALAVLVEFCVCTSAACSGNSLFACSFIAVAAAKALKPPASALRMVLVFIGPSMRCRVGKVVVFRGGCVCSGRLSAGLVCLSLDDFASHFALPGQDSAVSA